MRRQGTQRSRRSMQIRYALGAALLVGLACVVYVGSSLLHPHGEPPTTSILPQTTPTDALSSSSRLLGAGRDAAVPRSVEDVTEVTFTMTSPFIHAWKTSSKRDTFPAAFSFSFESGNHAADAEVVVPGTATFYGKSSLKLGYTSRRSLDVQLASGKDAPGGVERFVLLSLWEDKYRLAYLSAVRILERFKLFFPRSQLVIVRCSSEGAEEEDMCKRPLGVYLMLEYPSSAIHRTMSRSVPNKSPPPATEEAFGAQRVCEDAQSWNRRNKVLLLANGPRPPVVRVGARNWFYFEKPPIYDILDVPSFKRNATELSGAYRVIERDPLLLQGGAAGGNKHIGTGSYFDLNMYVVWLVVNSLLENGDYDDEVFIYSVTPSSKTPSSYFSIMAWDYDSIFTPCHRKGKNALRSTPLYCAETPLERLIVDKHHEYLKRVAQCVLNSVTVPVWNSVLGATVARLESLLGVAGVKEATFSAEISLRDGQRELEGAFAAQWGRLAKRFDVSANPSSNSLGGDAKIGRAAEVAAPTSCAAATLRTLRESPLKKEFKQSMHITAKSALVPGATSIAVLGPTATSPTVLFSESVPHSNAAGYHSTQGGMHCAMVSCGGGLGEVKQTTFMPMVLRDKDRGTAEFGVWQYQKPDVSSTFTHRLPETAAAVVQVRCPLHWPHDLRVPMHFRVTALSHAHQENSDDTATAAGLIRENLEVRVAGGGGGGPLGDEPANFIVRGHSVAFADRPDKPGGIKAHIPALQKEEHRAGPGGGDDIKNGRQNPSTGEVVQCGIPLSLLEGIQWFVWHSGGPRPDAAPAADDAILNPLGRPYMYIRVEGAVEVPRGSQVTIPAGSVLLMTNGASLVVMGALNLLGTSESPISIVGEKRDFPWKTILAEGGGVVSAEYVFVTGSGVLNARQEGTGKHHTRSSAFTSVGKGSTVRLRHCALVDLKGPGITAGLKATAVVEHSAVQWAEMGVECVMCDFTSLGSTWSHIPSSSTAYEDNDNDGMYLSGGTHRVIHSTIAHTKDDGIDSGTPEGFVGDGGSLFVSESILEMITHEAIALSSSPKASRSATIQNTGIAHAQQGIEMGYSGPACKGTISGTSIYHTNIAIRYGDNYYNRRQEGVLVVHLPDEGSGQRDTSAPSLGIRLLYNGLNSLSYSRNSAAAAAEDRFTLAGTSSSTTIILPGTFEVVNPCYRSLSLKGLLVVAGTPSGNSSDAQQQSRPSNVISSHELLYQTTTNSHRH